MIKGLIPAFRSGESLQSEIRQRISLGSEDEMDIWWLGQSGFLIQWNKNTLLFDPYLSDSLTVKYAQTTKPHVRMSELVIHPLLLDKIDVVTSSHNHTDHLDAETLKPILQNNQDIRFVIPEANRSFVSERTGCSIELPLGLNDGQEKHVGPFVFHGVPAAHNNIERDEKGQCRFMGFVVKFGKFTVYHSGDTLWYDDMVSILKNFHIDIAFLPINGNDPSRGVAGNLNGDEAASVGKSISAKLVIPHHYHMFEFNTAEPDLFESAAARLNQPYRTLRPGEMFTYSNEG